MDEWPSGTRVENPAYRYTGTVIRWETKHRTRWVVIQRDGEAFAGLEHPSAWRPVVES